jgi:hypothetical protein
MGVGRPTGNGWPTLIQLNELNPKKWNLIHLIELEWDNHYLHTGPVPIPMIMIIPKVISKLVTSSCTDPLEIYSGLPKFMMYRMTNKSEDEINQ